MSESPVFEYSFTVSESQIDAFDHLHNVDLYRLFEAARWQMVQALGFSREHLITHSWGLVILYAEVTFAREVRLGETCIIKSHFKPTDQRTGSFVQSVTNEKGLVVSFANFGAGSFSLTSRTLVDFPPEWRAAVGL